jgi:hypothetical protein
MATPTFDYEDVRRQVIAQIQTLEGWKHARHLFTGISTQGAVIGDRTFDVKAGTATPTTSARGGMERVKLQVIVRMRHRASLLQSAAGVDPSNADRRAVRIRMQTGGLEISSAVDVRWIGDGAPLIRVNGFQDTDQTYELEFWSPIVVPGPNANAGVQ